jgi:hypothetical protein
MTGISGGDQGRHRPGGGGSDDPQGTGRNGPLIDSGRDTKIKGDVAGGSITKITQRRDFRIGLGGAALALMVGGGIYIANDTTGGDQKSSDVATVPCRDYLQHDFATRDHMARELFAGTSFLGSPSLVPDLDYTCGRTLNVTLGTKREQYLRDQDLSESLR